MFNKFLNKGVSKLTQANSMLQATLDVFDKSTGFIGSQKSTGELAMSQSPKSPTYGKDVSLFSDSRKPKASVLDESDDKAKFLDKSSSSSKGSHAKESVFEDSPKENTKEKKKRKKSADKDKVKKHAKTHEK